jgi:hypothetical protein
MFERKIRIIPIVAALLLIITGCDDKKKKDAGRMLDRAVSLYENKQFIVAKSVIDSVNTLYPREIDARKEALTLMRLVERGESEQNIMFCDSLLPVRIKELEALRKGFVFEKDSLYDDKGRYVWQSMTVERNVEHSYVRCGVNEDGEMYMASVYFGSRPVEHTGLKLSTANGVFAQTPSIPYDGGVNYRFKDNGNSTEVVAYKGLNCKTVANFVYNLSDKERIKAEFTGGKPFSIFLSDNDKKAIKATYELALTLSEITAMKNEKVKSEKRILRIDEKTDAGF